MGEALDSLTRINLDDLVGAFGWNQRGPAARLARWLFHEPAQSFARQMLTFDAETGQRGLVEAARRTERLHVRDVRVYGAEHLPEGAFLALSNHPGLTDTLALFAALRRPDLRVIALDRPFLVALGNVSRQLFYLPESPQERVGLVRQVARHLKNGGAVLTFPAGRNEPDPQVYAGAAAALEQWLESAEVFVSLAPGTPIVPVCVRGVTWERASHNFLAGLRRRPDDHQLLASALQLLWQSTLGIPPVTVRVQIGRPIYASGRGTSSRPSLHEMVLEAMRSLIEGAPQGEGVSVL